MSDAPFAEIDAGLVATLTAERQRRGLSMRAVARTLGKSPSVVHDWEHGVKVPSLDNAQAWAEVLGFQLTLTRPNPPAGRRADYLLDGSPEAVALVREARGLPPLTRDIPPEGGRK